jgi:hypothetical protein
MYAKGQAHLLNLTDKGKSRKEKRTPSKQEQRSGKGRNTKRGTSTLVHQQRNDKWMAGKMKASGPVGGIGRQNVACAADKKLVNILHVKEPQMGNTNETGTTNGITTSTVVTRRRTRG